MIRTLLPCLLLFIAASIKAEDPSPLVESGLFKRIAPEKVLDEMQKLTRNTEQSFFLYFGSDVGGGCGYCRKSQQVMAGNTDLLKKYNFTYLYTSFEPYTEFSQHPEVQRSFNLYGVPAYYVFHNGRMFMARSGAALSKISLHSFLEVTKYMMSFKGIDRYANIKTWKDYTLRNHSMTDHLMWYALQPGPKAIAVVVDGVTYAQGRALEAKDQSAANKLALEQCEQNRKERNVADQCQLLVQGNKVVDQSLTQETRDMLALALKYKGVIPD